MDGNNYDCSLGYGLNGLDITLILYTLWGNMYISRVSAFPPPFATSRWSCTTDWVGGTVVFNDFVSRVESELGSTWLTGT